MCKESAVRAALTAAQEHCALCPRRCGAARRETAGLCGMGAELKVARAALHYWEEPCISGCDGSGTVFFSGCTLRCVFCQNREISAGGFGQAISVERLREVFHPKGLPMECRTGSRRSQQYQSGQPYAVCALDRSGSGRGAGDSRGVEHRGL